MRWGTYPGDTPRIDTPALFVLAVALLVALLVAWCAWVALDDVERAPEPLAPAVYVVDPTVQAERVP